MQADSGTDTPARVTIRELQRHTSDVLAQVEQGEVLYITKHGRTIARVLPPDPADEAISKAIAAGILDPRVISEPYTTAQMLEDLASQPEGSPGERPLSEVVLELREAEGER